MATAVTYHRWRDAIPAAARSWDDELDCAALCHDLFGVCVGEAHGTACVRFLCSPPGDAEDDVVLQLWTLRTLICLSPFVAGLRLNAGCLRLGAREGVICVLIVYDYVNATCTTSFKKPFKRIKLDL